METQLARLERRIEKAQTELSGLKQQRKELKARLAEAKKAWRHGDPLPSTTGPEGLVSRIGAALSETVVEPIAELLNPAPARP
jgi:hypothetical protein